MLSLIRFFRSHGLVPVVIANGTVVCCYHGVAYQRHDSLLERNFHLLSDFRDHVKFLRRQRVVPLAELAHGPDRSHWDQPAVSITFDDGYANNLLAAEILAEANLPWTLFVSVEPINEDGVIWAVELSLLLLRGKGEVVEALDRLWSLKTRRGREAAFRVIRHRLKGMAANSRRQAM